MTKKTMGLLLTALLFNLPHVWAMEDIDEKHLLNNKFLIKNIEHRKYLYLSEDNQHIVSDGGKIWEKMVFGNQGIAREHIFIFEKTSEGYLIKNVKYNKFLYVTSSDKVGGSRIVEASSHATKGSNYFDIIKVKEEGYAIKNKVFHSYLLLSDTHWHAINGDRVVKSCEERYKNSYFNFVVCSQDMYDDILL